LSNELLVLLHCFTKHFQLVYQTNHNIDLISTANQNESTRLKTVRIRWEVSLSRDSTRWKKSARFTWQNVRKYHLFTSTRL